MYSYLKVVHPYHTFAFKSISILPYVRNKIGDLGDLEKHRTGTPPSKYLSLSVHQMTAKYSYERFLKIIIKCDTKICVIV